MTGVERRDADEVGGCATIEVRPEEYNGGPVRT